MHSDNRRIFCISFLGLKTTDSLVPSYILFVQLGHDDFVGTTSSLDATKLLSTRTNILQRASNSVTYITLSSTGTPVYSVNEAIRFPVLLLPAQ
jgi:hypothetical protein